MSDVDPEEPRNITQPLLDRVAAGEGRTITVDGRPVAWSVGVERRPRLLPKDEFLRLFDGYQADPGLTAELQEMLGDETTDDLRW